MRAEWHALHEDLLRQVSRHKTTESFRTMQARRSSLRRFSEPLAMLDWLHLPGAAADEKNTVLRDLVHEAQAGDRDSGAACVLLHLALWPGLDAVHGRLRRYFRSDPALLAAELSGQFVEQVLELDTGRVDRIAATLVMNVERDVKRSLGWGRKESWQRVALDHPDALGHEVGGSVLGLAVRADTDRDAAAIADRLRKVLGSDADLVLDVAVRGFTQREAAVRHNLTHDAARKRYQRALDRLREVFGDLS